MTFHVYPDPQTDPQSVAAATTGPATPIVELVGNVGGVDTMFVRVAMSVPGCVAAALADPGILFAANGGAATEVTSLNAVDPTPLAGGTVFATIFPEPDGVYRVEMYKFTTSPISWQITLRNDDPTEAVDFTWVVADAEAESRQPWIEVPHTVDWDDLVGTTLTGQQVPLSVAVANRGTGGLTVTNATGAVGGSSFELTAVPGTVDPGACEDLDLVFNAPATPGQETGVVLDLATNDTTATTGTPTASHNRRIELSGSRGQLEVMLLLDASGSMGYQPDGTPPVAQSDKRWAKLVVAAEQFLDLLGDFGNGLGRFGISVFPDITDPAFPPLAPSPSAAHLHPPTDISDADISAGKDSLEVDDPPQPSGGATPIGFGIGHTMGTTAGSFGDFESSAEAVAHNVRVLVLMSDGAHNSGLHPSEFWRTDEGTGCGDPGTAGSGESFLDKGVRVVTVAYGDPSVTAFEVDHEMLDLIACKSNGVALDAGIADVGGASLQKSFRDALIDGLALDPTVDPGGVLTANHPSVQRQVTVLPSDTTVSFVLDWATHDFGRVNLDLLTPDCQLISPRLERTFPGISFHRTARYAVYTVSESFLRNEEDPENPRYGEWTLMISSRDLDEGDNEPYSYAVLTRSRLRLRLSADASSHVAGDTIDLTAALRLDGAPIRGASVTLEVDRPGQAAMNWLAAVPATLDEIEAAREDLGDDEVTAIGLKAHALHRRGLRFDPLPGSSALTMTETSAGVYTATLPSTATPGTYSFRAIAVGELDGDPFRREQRLQVRVGVRPEPEFTLVDVAYLDPGEGRLQTSVRVWPRDRFGNVVMIDPAIDPTLAITGVGGEATSAIETRFDGSYVRTLVFPRGTPPAVSVSVGGEEVVTARPVPPPEGLYYVDHVVELDLGGEAEPGANQHREPHAVLGNPVEPPRDFLALGAAGSVTVAVEGQQVGAQGDDDVHVFVSDGSLLRSYRVEARTGWTGKWVELGTSGGVSTTFSLAAAGLKWASAVRVTDTSLRTRNPDLSVSSAPGVNLAGVGFRRVGEPPKGCLWLPGWLQAIVERLLRLGGSRTQRARG